MLEIFRSGGFIMWPLLLIAVWVLVLAGRVSLAARSGEPALEIERRLVSILVWGALAAVLGLLGTVVGLVQMARAIGTVAGGTIVPATLWSGIQVTLVTLIFGLLILAVAMLLWAGLRQWSGRSSVVPA